MKTEFIQVFAPDCLYRITSGQKGKTMKIKENFVLREIAGTNVVLPVGSANVDLNGMIKLNGSGVLLWRALEAGADRKALIDAILSEYDIDRATAEADVNEFLVKLARIGCLEG